MQSRMQKYRCGQQITWSENDANVTTTMVHKMMFIFQSWLRHMQHNMQIHQRDIGMVWLSVQEGALATHTNGAGNHYRGLRAYPLTWSELRTRIKHDAKDENGKLRQSATAEVENLGAKGSLKTAAIER